MLMFALLVADPMLNRTARVMVFKGRFRQRGREPAGADGTNGLDKTGGGGAEIDGLR